MKTYLLAFLIFIPTLTIADAPNPISSRAQKQILRKEKRKQKKRYKKQQRRIARINRFLSSKRGKKLANKISKRQKSSNKQPRKWDRLFGFLVLSPFITYYALAGAGLPFIHILGIAILGALTFYFFSLLLDLALPYIGTHK